jgi:hypothetical protein
VLVGTHAEVLDGLASILGTTEQEGVASSGGTESQLIQSQALTTGSKDAGAGGGGETESGNGDLRDLEEAVVVGDGTNDNDGLAGLVALGDLGLDARKGHRGLVNAGHKQAAQDNLCAGNQQTDSIGIRERAG